MILSELKTSPAHLKGVGPKTVHLLSQMGMTTIADLLLNIPRGWDDRTTQIPIAGQGRHRAVTAAEIIAHDFFGFGPKRTLKIIIRERLDLLQDHAAPGTAAVLVCFGRSFLANSLTPGKIICLTGTFQYRFGEWQCSDFETEPWKEDTASFFRIFPLYHLTAGLTQAAIQKIEYQAVAAYGKFLEEEIPPWIQEKRQLLKLPEALAGIHTPTHPDEAEKARRTLAYREFFILHLTSGIESQARRLAIRPARKLSSALAETLIDALPFSLTPDQTTVVDEIKRDMEQPVPMARLVQGDVGCGKTLVAFLAALYQIGAGYQVAFMAPTELLARQHAEKAAALLEPRGIRLAFLSGTVTGESRKNLLAALAGGHIDLIIGTHSLFSQDIRFHSLGLAIVDEQHRFGVLQRQSLLRKGQHPDMLLLTATPIPQTLALTAFGDLSISTIRTMPPGRVPILTHLSKHGHETRVYDWVKREIDAGHQAYFVYPRIEEDESIKSAEVMFGELSVLFAPRTVALIHSQMEEDTKRSTMDAFARGEIQILVATSVVEVGVDVANATCMVIEEADRFGLSALHQLRGRVGRSSLPSHCFLVYREPLSEDAVLRLKAIRETTDGFRLAEEDLRLRGPGDLSGIRQSGFMKTIAADLTVDVDLLTAAREDVTAILTDDSRLEKPENRHLKSILDQREGANP